MFEKLGQFWHFSFKQINPATVSDFNLSPFIFQGQCFTFNSDGGEFTDTTGYNGGLIVWFRTNPEEYSMGPTSHAPGVLVNL